MNKGVILMIGLLILTVSCNKRLDSFLFNGSEIDEYKLDLYDGETALELPPNYFIADNDIHLFTYKIEDDSEELEISAIYVGDLNAMSKDTVILYCHGNKDHMDHYWPRQKLLSFVGGKFNYGVLMFDYPGYGLSEGTSSEKNMYEATNGAMKWLKEQGVEDNRLVIYGYSLGSAPASKAVGDKPFVLNPNKIILEAPFASSEVMIQDAALLGMPSSFFVNAKIDNAEQIKKCQVPLYWMHGIDDDFLSLENHGKVVYKNHKHAWKQKDQVPGAGHNDVPTFMGLEEYKQKVLQFIRSSNIPQEY